VQKALYHREFQQKQPYCSWERVRERESERESAREGERETDRDRERGCCSAVCCKSNRSLSILRSAPYKKQVGFSKNRYRTLLLWQDSFQVICGSFAEMCGSFVTCQFLCVCEALLQIYVRLFWKM